MAMMENQGKEVQTCLLTHTVRSEMQMAELATTPPPRLQVARIITGK